MADSEVGLVLLDVGDVLLHWQGGLEQLSKTSGKSLERVKRVFDILDPLGCKGTINEPLFSWLIAVGLGMPRPWEFRLEKVWTKTRQPITEMHELVYELAEEYPVGVLSNAYRGMMRSTLEHGHIPNVDYRVVVVSADVGEVKPRRAIYEATEARVARSLGLAPREIFFVDNLPENLVVPSEMGWQVERFDPDDRVTSVASLRTKLL